MSPNRRTDEVPPTPAGHSLARRIALWLCGLVIAALATIIVQALTGIPGQLVDVDAIKDLLRPGPDFRYTLDVVYLEDEGYAITAPGNYKPTPEQRRLMRKLDNVTAPLLTDQLRAAGSVDLSDLTLRVTLEGRSNQDVRILGIRPVVERTAPLDGTLFFAPSQEGEPWMNMIVDLDDPMPVLRKADENGTPGRPYFDNNSIWLPDHEQDVLVIRVMESSVPRSSSRKTRWNQCSSTPVRCWMRPRWFVPDGTPGVRCCSSVSPSDARTTASRILSR